jgi:hypothetical protein
VELVLGGSIFSSSIAAASALTLFLAALERLNSRAPPPLAVKSNISAAIAVTRIYRTVQAMTDIC